MNLSQTLKSEALEQFKNFLVDKPIARNELMGVWYIPDSLSEEFISNLIDTCIERVVEKIDNWATKEWVNYPEAEDVENLNYLRLKIKLSTLKDK